jgi:hypothetical protein
LFTVVHNNVYLVRKEGKMTTLAVALARDAFLGEEVMAQCTAKECGIIPSISSCFVRGFTSL